MIHRDTLIFRTFCVVFWLAACVPFILEEIVPQLAGAVRYLYFLTDGITLILGLICLTGRKQWLTFLSFLLIAFASKWVNHSSLLETFNGMREFLPMLFFLPIAIRLFTSSRGAEFRDSFLRQMKVFLWIQAFCITEQFIKYGANDHGGGSLGFGGSGIISLSIITLSFYFITREWDSENYLQSLKKNWMYIFLLYPVFLNETKVSFVVLLVYFVLLYKFELRSIGKILIAAPLFLILFVGSYYLYSSVTGQLENDVASKDFVEEYLVGTDVDDMFEKAMLVEDGVIDAEDMGLLDLARFMKIGLIPTALETARGGMILGAGLGVFKGGTFLELTPFAKQHHWMLTGTIPMLFYIVIQLGLLGLIWFGWLMYDAIAMKRRYGPMSLQVKLFLLAVVVIVLFYNDTFRYSTYSYIFFCLCALISYPPTTDEAVAEDSNNDKLLNTDENV